MGTKKTVEILEANLQDANMLTEKPTSQWALTLRRFRGRRSGMIGFGIVTFLIIIAVFAPMISPYDPNEVLIGKEDVGPREKPCVHILGCDPDQPQHILGTDANVRDEYTRIVFGARVSLTLGFFTVTIALIVGTFFGAVAGYVGGWFDNVTMRVMDVIAYARVTRAQVLSIKETDFVAASKALGASGRQIIIRRVLPNALTPLVVLATLGVATAILEAAGLSFLGLGAQPPLAEWGTMLATERNNVFTSPHLVFFPGLMIMITVLGFNLMGDGLRDALDPSLNK